MKKVLILLFFTINLSLSATTYYVSPTGNDGASGTINAPWKSWNYAFNRLVAGDILYVRGGTYTVMGGLLSGNRVGARTKLRATQNAQITVSAYPGDSKPVLDCSSLASVSGYRRGILTENCSYWNFKGLTVKSLREYSGSPTSYTGSGWEIVDSDHIILENCTVTDCMQGFDVSGTVTNISYINCDAYDNYDIYQKGDLCNGFSGNARGASTISYAGCRAWRNSDDGWDNMAGSGYYTYTNCWAWKNGPWHGGDESGNGCGFKLGYDASGWVGTGTQRTLKNCVAVWNHLIGIEGSLDGVTSMNMELYNCISAHNLDYGIRFDTYNSGTKTIKNCVAYANASWGDYVTAPKEISANNSWNLPVTANDADFVSTEYSQLANPRNADGSLPTITSFHLVTGSDLIDAGVDVGLPFSGKAPDIGAFEMQAGTTPSIPVYTSSAIENATPSLLEMTYNLILADVAPAASAFSVLVNSNARTVSKVTISGTKVQLTLASPIVYGDVVTVAYTKPSDNPLQTASGGQAITITSQAVTNRVSPVKPVYVSSAIENTTPSLLEMTYNLTLVNVTPAASAFSVLVNSNARSVSKVAISGTMVQLTLVSPIVYGDVVTVSYIKPSTNPLQTASGGQASTITAQAVTNKVSPVKPVYVSSAIENATPSLLEMTYNLTLANVTPASSAFSVLVNSNARTVSKVAISGTMVQLTLASPIVYGDVVTVSYTKPSTNPLQTASAGQASSITAQAVTNRVSQVKPVYVSSAIENATPSLLEMTYNLTLANVAPAASAFSVLVNSNARTVSKVAISGTMVQLTLASPIVYGDVVTVSYTKPSTNPLQTASGGQASTITAQSVTNRVSPVKPVYVSSAIENATPSLLEMTYNLTLANVAPAASAFSVLVNSKARTVNKVAVSGTKVQLTLASPVIYGDIVTVTYTKPSTNPLKTASGGQASTITAQAVTNRVNPVNPVYVSSAIANATPSLLEMTYNLTLANVAPAASAFSVLVNSKARTVNKVAVSGTKVQLTLATPVVFGDVVTVSYTKPATNPVQTASAGQAATISNQPVTNNRVNVAPATAIISPENNKSFTTPSNITITASASDADGSITLVEFFNGSTKLGSASVAPYSFTWNNVAAGTYALTVTATDNRNAKTTSSAISILVNDVTPSVNQPPVVTISNPQKGNKYENPATIVIDAVASDPDGTIRKIELYSGSDKLGELTSPPYSYTWKDVKKGTYSISAVATDNLDATTSSTSVEFTVGDVSGYDGNSEIFNLYPNPNDGHFWIEFVNPLQNEKGEIIITDLAGKQIYHKPFVKEETLKSFDLSYIKSGIYIVMITNKEILVTKKLIKE